MSSLSPRIDKIEKAVYGNEIEVAKIDAPFTEIVNEQGNPRQIPDLTNNMKTSMGVERITTTSITTVTNEFGPNGKQVYEAQNRDPRIRFVGNWDNVVNAFGGTHPTIDTTETDGFAEITFYGTGLNILMSSAAGAIDGRAIVDGGADFNFKSGISNILSNRNYKHNIIFPVTSGLSLGVHTVKIYKTDTIGGFSVDGVEILNETSQLTTNPGKPKIDSSNRELQSQILSSYNSDFDAESDVLGTKGGRVLVYQDIDGNINKRLKATDVTAQYLSLADHSNEEIIRTINYREFGASRSDDFSTLPTSISDRAFTLDDGITSLLGNDVRDGSFDAAAFPNGGAYVNSSGTAGGLILTFVGTGLDIIVTFGNSPETIDISIDGASVGSMSYDNNEKSVRRTIASGLPYGTHTVRIERGGGASQWISIEDFIIYGPKKPELSSTDIELVDYNIVADYDSANQINLPGTNEGNNYIAQGVICKTNVREFTYNGTFTGPNLTVTHPWGHNTSSTVNSSYYEYTFFGTDFIISHHGTSTGNGSVDISVEIDGVLNDSGVGLTGWTNNGGGSYNMPGAIPSGTPARLEFTGLALGLHTVRVTRTGQTGSMNANSFHYHTPIHINENSFKVGSLSLKDSTISNVNTESKSKVDLTKAKAWLKYDAVSNEILSSYNISAVIDDGAGIATVYFNHPFKDADNISVNVSTYATSIINGYLGFPTKNKITVTTRRTDSQDVVDSKFFLTVFGELENEEDLDLGDL